MKPLRIVLFVLLLVFVGLQLVLERVQRRAVHRVALLVVLPDVDGSVDRQFGVGVIGDQKADLEL